MGLCMCCPTDRMLMFASSVMHGQPSTQEI